MTWGDTRLACAQHDMTVVNFDTSLEATNYLNLKPSHVWMGMTDIWVRGTFWKYNGLRTVQNGFLRWSPGEPNNGPNENCIDASATGYSDVDCYKQQQAGCMRPTYQNQQYVEFDHSN